MRAAGGSTYWPRLVRRVRRARLRLAIGWRRLIFGDLLQLVRRDAREAARARREAPTSATGTPEAGRAAVGAATDVGSVTAKPTATRRSPQVRRTER